MNASQPTYPRADELRLDAALIDVLAVRVAELLAGQLQAPVPASERPARLLSAAEVSQWWGVRRGWVYQHADQLGAIRIGDGQRPRLRFDPDKVSRYLQQQQPGRPIQAACPPAVSARGSRRIRGDAPRLAFRADPELSSSHSNQEMAGRRANAPGRGAEEQSFGAMTSLPPTTPGVDRSPSRPASPLRRHDHRR